MSTPRNQYEILRKGVLEYAKAKNFNNTFRKTKVLAQIV